MQAFKYLQYIPMLLLISSFVMLLYQLVKLTKTEETKEILQKANLINTVKKHWIWVVTAQMLMFLAFCIFSLLCDFNHASIKIEFTYSEVQQGLNPNGTRFNASSMMQDEVLNLVIDDMKLNMSTDELRDCINIAKTGSEQELQATSSPKMTSEFSIQTTDEIYKYPFLSAETLLDSYSKQYKDYFISTYAGNFSLLNLDGIEDVKDMDYLEMNDYFLMYADNIQHLVNKFANENNTYEYGGMSFEDLRKRLDNFETVTLERFKSYVLDNGLQKDGSQYVQWVSYQNKLKDVQLQKYRAGYDIRLDAINLYDEKMATVVLVPTRDTDDEFYMQRTQIGVDYLAEEANVYSNKATELQNQISTNNYAVRMIQSSGAGVNVYAAADEMSNSIISDLKAMGQDALQLTTEYIKYKRDGYLKVEASETQLAQKLDIKKGMLVFIISISQMIVYYAIAEHRKH